MQILHVRKFVPVYFGAYERRGGGIKYDLHVNNIFLLPSEKLHVHLVRLGVINLYIRLILLFGVTSVMCTHSNTYTQITNY